MAATHDQSYQTGIYLEQGGQTLHVGNTDAGPSGVGASIVQGSNGKELPVDLAVVVTNAPAGVANHSAVTFQVQDGLGNNIAYPVFIDVWLSDAVTGAGLTATTASGGFTVTTGALVATYTASKAIRVQTDVTGKVVLNILDTAKTLFVPCAGNAFDVPQVGAALTAGSYT
jgi:hypothetical protein